MVGTACGKTFWVGVAGLVALILVLLVGVAVQLPLVQVQENTLKFVVVLMLASF